MRFIITPDQRDFFRKNHFIEFDDLLSGKTIATVCKESDEILLKRVNCAPSKSNRLSSLYKAGYDLWRDSPAIKIATQKLSIAHIASELFQTYPLRIAFDQFLTPKMPLFQSSFSLMDISSIQPLAGGVFFLLENLDDDPVQKMGGFPLPKNAGNALFFSPTLAIPWPAFARLSHLKLLLVAFAPKKSFYCPEANDPHSPSFKKLGYVYNDLLKETLHPIIFGKK